MGVFGFWALARYRSLRPALLGLFIALAGFSAACAHPHIWIDARIVLAFNGAGEISAIKHEWTFDQAFSSWSIQGLDIDGDGQISEAELQSLADENIVGLEEYEFYTFAGQGATKIGFSALPGQRISYDGARTTLRFTLEPDHPIAPGREYEIEVSDPEYYAAFTFLTDRGVTLENAPGACSAEVNPPKPIDPEIEAQLFQLGPEVTELPPELKSAADDLANVVIVRCDGSGAAAVNPPANAQQATQQLASGAGRGAPFVAPPAEKGLPVVQTGFLGWVNQMQRNFYQALTQSLAVLKTDANAFWFLGALSFAYGVFHAAGPGHGKVVISSYVLASQRELRLGLLLSFMASLVQALVAIVFVLVAAALFKLSSLALSQASGWLVNGSYVLVILMGVYLIWRKLSGRGHEHGGHDAHGKHGHDHDHPHHHDMAHPHHHIVAPDDVRGNWREMAGVVLSVGLRPCSGALVVMVFALSQGLAMAGIAAVLLMGLGTAITVSVLATLALGLKQGALRFSHGPFGAIALDVVWWLELFGALLVFGFGVLLLWANL